MPFSAQRSVLLEDKTGNLYHIYEYNHELKLIYFTKTTGTNRTYVLTKEAGDEFTATMDGADYLYILSKTGKNRLSLFVFHGEAFEEHTILEHSETEIFHLHVMAARDELHLLFARSTPDPDKVNAEHHVLSQGNWNSYPLGDLTVHEVLNDFTLTVYDECLYLAYYDTRMGEENIFIRKFENGAGWGAPVQITTGPERSMYFDFLLLRNDTLVCTYSLWEDGNLAVYALRGQYEPGISFTETHRRKISDPSNSALPTLLQEGNRLWCIWTQYENVMSAVSEDGGKTYSEPYLWRTAHNTTFLRFQFFSNNPQSFSRYTMNAVYGVLYPELSFVGFGDLKRAELQQKRTIQAASMSSTTERSASAMANNNLPIRERVDSMQFTVESLHQEVTRLQQENRSLNESLKMLSKELTALKKLSEETLKRGSEDQKDPSEVFKYELSSLATRIMKIENYLKNRMIF